MRPEVEHHLLVAAAENPRVGQSGQAGADLDGSTSSVVENTVVEGPPVNIPNPAGEGAVYERGPEEDEDHSGKHATSLGDRADDESCGYSAEHHLDRVLVVAF